MSLHNVPVDRRQQAVECHLVNLEMMCDVEEEQVGRASVEIVAGDGVELKMKCEGFTATQTEYLIRVQQANLLLKKIKWLAEYS